MTRRKQMEKLELDAESSHLEGLIGYNLKRAYVIVQTDFRRVLGDDGFSPRAYSALSLVAQFPNITQTGLSKMLGIERSGLVAIIDDLEGRELVQRTTVAGDRRAQALLPTPKGIKALAEATATVRAHENTLFADFSQEDRATLIELLQRIRGLGEDK